MPHVQPLFLPKPVVEENKLVLENDFGVTPAQFSFGPDGLLCVLSQLFYNYYRYDKSDSRSFSSYLVNVYGPDLGAERLADFSAFYREADRDDYLKWDLFHPYLSVTPENLVVLTTQANRTFLFDAALENRVGQFASSDPKQVQQIYDAGFAYHAEPLADGRLLCLVSEPGVQLRWFSPNLLCLSDGSPLSPGQRPNLTCIACLKPDLTVDATFPHVHLPDGTRVGKGNRPTPSLEQLAEKRYDLSLYGCWIGQALPLGEGTCLVTLFHKLMRGGSKGSDFVFALISEDGRLVGRVDGIDPHDDSPFVDHHYRVAVDRARGRIVYKTRASFFLFDLKGKLLNKVELEGPARKGLSVFKLGGCGPDGRIVLYHPEQHLLLQLDPIDQPGDLRATLADGLAFYKRERTRLKKQHEVVAYRWMHPGPIVRH
jgi:hypothetical protein